MNSIYFLRMSLRKRPANTALAPAATTAWVLSKPFASIWCAAMPAPAIEKPMPSFFMFILSSSSEDLAATPVMAAWQARGNMRVAREKSQKKRLFC